MSPIVILVVIIQAAQAWWNFNQLRVNGYQIRINRSLLDRIAELEKPPAVRPADTPPAAGLTPMDAAALGLPLRHSTPKGGL
jgi:hypothetical protein